MKKKHVRNEKLQNFAIGCVKKFAIVNEKLNKNGGKRGVV